jgi:hypothetical protein
MPLLFQCFSYIELTRNDSQPRRLPRDAELSLMA